MSLGTKPFLTAIALTLVVVACGSSDGSNFPDEKASDGEPGGPGGDNAIGGNGAGDEKKLDPVNDACATAKIKADRQPLHMVVVLDKSGSMCEYTSSALPRNCNNPNSKWQQVTSALATFFASPQSAGMSVSLIAFPVGNGTCNASSYQTPLKASVTLPDTAGVLANEMKKLDGDGNTPTRPALEGAINYAKTVEASLKGQGKVAVVMATDGYPQECSNNSINDASMIATAVKGTIPTYVVGVGNLLSNLNNLAAAGGTTQAFLVSTTTSSAVGQSFAEALSKIRSSALACEFGMPAAPAGSTIDTKRVNVRYTGGSGVAETLPQSPDCANMAGWRYDDPAKPTKIMLCKGACDRAKVDGAAAVEVVLGCQTADANGGTVN